MSGWNGRTGHYEVLLSKMRRWHAGGHWDAEECWCVAMGGYSDETLVQRLRERGFEVEGDEDGYPVVVGGPGIEEGSTAALYEAVSGRPGRDPAWSRRPAAR
jgi:hypothetical protein